MKPNNLISFQKFLFTIFFASFVKNNEKCLPSKQENTCFVCKYDYYYFGGDVINGENLINDSSCKEKSIQETKYLKLFVNSENNCVQKECDGTLDNPYDDLFKALFEGNKKIDEYIFSELQYFILGKNHVLRHNEKIELFRRKFVKVHIKPLFCDEIIVDGCYESQMKAVITIQSPFIHFYISRELILKDLVISCGELSDFKLSSESKNSLAINYEAEAGLFNIERIIDEINPGDWGAPALEITNCVLENIYAFGGQKISQEKTFRGFANFIGINNNWGSTVVVMNSNIVGGYFGNGFILHTASHLSSLYKNINQDWLIQRTNIIAMKSNLNFYFFNNTFTSNNDHQILNFRLPPQSFIKSTSLNNFDDYNADLKIVFNASENTINNFLNEKYLLIKFLDFDGLVRRDSVFSLLNNKVTNNSFEIFAQFYRNVNLIEIFGGILDNNTGNYLLIRFSNVLIENISVINHQVLNYLVSIDSSSIFIHSSLFERVRTINNFNDETKSLIFVMFYFNTVLDDEFNSPFSKNSSGNYIFIEKSLFDSSNLSLILEPPQASYITQLNLKKCLFANLSLEREFVKISVEHLLNIELSIFEYISSKDIFLVPFARNFKFVGTVFNNILASLLRVNNIGLNSNNSIYFTIINCSFSDIHSHFNPYIFIVDVAYVSSRFNVALKSSELNNIIINSSARYNWNFEPPEEKYWVFIFSNSQVVFISDLNFSQMHFCSGIYLQNLKQSSLPYSHSSIFMNNIIWSNNFSNTFSFLKIIEHRQTLLSKINITSYKTFMNNNFLDIYLSIGALSLNKIFLDIVGSFKPGAVLKLDLHNVTVLHIDDLFLVKGPNLFNSVLIYINTQYRLGLGNLKNYKNNNLAHSNVSYNETDASLGFINMPRNFGIYNANLYDASTNNEGIIIVEQESEFVMINCTLKKIENKANKGGIVILERSSAYIENCSFEDFKADSGGAFMLLKKSSVLTSVSLFFTQTLGTAIYMEKSFAEIEKGSFKAGKALWGGALFCISSVLKIVNSNFIENGVNYNGGALFSDESWISLLNVTFINNSAGEDGGAALFIHSDEIFLINILVTKCKSFRKGNINFNSKSGSKMNIYYLVCRENQAGSGTCLHQEEGNLNLFDSFLFGNTGLNLITTFSLLLSAHLSLKNIKIEENYFQEECIVCHSTSANLFNVTFKKNSDSKAFLKLTDSQLQMTDIIMEKKEWESSNCLYYFINSENSKINVSFLKANGGKSAGFLNCKQNIINLFHSSFNSFTNLKGSVFFLKDFNSLKASNLTLIENEADQGSVVYSENANIVFDYSFFSNNKNSEGGADIFFKAKGRSPNKDILIFISNTRMEFSFLTIIRIQGIYQLKLSNVSIKHCLSYALNEKSMFLININTISFESCEFFLLPSIYLFSSILTEFSLLKCTFSNLQSQTNGGALILAGFVNLLIFENNFLNNWAKKHGGAIFFDFASEKLIEINIKNSNFFNNSAGSNGGALFINTPVRTMISETHFLNNKASVGNDQSGYPSRFEIRKISTDNVSIKELINSNPIEILSISKGEKTRMVVFLFDIFGNHLENLFEGFIIASPSENCIFQGNQVIVEQGAGLFNDFLIICDTGISTSFTLTYKTKTHLFKQQIKLFIKDCKRGEYLNINMCAPCGIGFFSLIKPSNEKTNINYCEICPPNAECLGRDIILSKPGFYRLHSNTSVFIPCKIDNACPAQIHIYESLAQFESITNSNSSFYHQVCSDGYIGNLCDKCRKDFSKNSEGLCIRCSNEISHFIKYFSRLLGSGLFIILQGVLAMKFGENRSKKRCLIKILINHSYFFSFITELKIMLSIEIDKFFGIPKDLVSFECFLAPHLSELNLYLSTYFLNLMQPIVLIVSCIIIRVIIVETFIFIKNRINKSDLKTRQLKLKQKNHFRAFIKKWSLIVQSLWVVSTYNLFSRTVFNTFELLKCIQLDESQVTFMEKYPDYPCWSSEEHKSLLLFAFLPNFLVWCVCWPAFLFGYLWYNNRKIIDKEVSNLKKARKSIFDKNTSKEIDRKHKIYKLLTIDYNKNCYFWEIIFYLINLLFSIIKLMISRLSPSIQASCLISFFALLLIITEITKPFQFALMNRLQVSSYIIMILNLAFSILDSNKNSPNFAKNNIYILIIILMNLGFFSILILLYLKIFLISIASSFFLQKFIKKMVPQKKIKLPNQKRIKLNFERRLTKVIEQKTTKFEF